MRPARVAVLLSQALAFVGFVGAVLAYSAFDPSLGQSTLSLTSFLIGYFVFFGFFSAAVALKFPFDVFLRLPIFILAAICVWRAIPLVASYPKLFAVDAPLQLILAYFAAPPALLATTLILAIDLVSDVRGLFRKTHAA